MATFYVYPAPTTMSGDEVIVVKQSGKNKSVTIDTALSDLGVLTDVVINTPSDGEVLKYVAATSKWVNGGSGTVINTINDISDVDTVTVTPVNNQTLSWDETGQKWAPGTIIYVQGTEPIGAPDNSLWIDTSI